MDPTVDLSQLPLRDIHLPGAVPWWPPAPGWWLIAAVAAVVALLAGWHYYRHRRQRVALLALRRVQVALESGVAPAVCLQQVSSVLRRFAMTTAHDGNDVPRAGAGSRGGGADDVAGLVGTAWLAYLDGRWQRDDFTRGAGRLLTAAPYAPPGHADRLQALELTALCVDWVRAQRRGHRAASSHGRRGARRAHARAATVRGA